ncbi:MAG: hypothetical protein IPF88_00045 [Candidatus Microthrix sp.]|nr:hypothetical protein [Candidatus Microthrix sp.]MBK6437013.1 hypothetical protein [Candidatus Microthrix sp.]
MVNSNRRFFLAGSAGLAGALAMTSCTTESNNASGDPLPDVCDDGAGCASMPTPGAAPGDDGLIDEAVYQRRVDEYLAFATTEFARRTGMGPSGASRLPLDVGGPALGLESGGRRLFGSSKAPGGLALPSNTASANAASFNAGMTTLAPDVIEAIEQRLVDNRYRYDDPNPDNRVDNLWYWSENHIIIGLVIEYLAGRHLSEETFTITGLTGAEHSERAKPGILKWIDERARFGFFEWHSNVYMLKNITPLVTLIELGGDEELAVAAAMALDLCLVDLAAHTHAGSYTAPRGRTYKKDKMTSRDEATFGVSKFLFDDTDFGFQNHTDTDTGTTYLCAATSYRPPRAVVDMAVAEAPGVVRERHGIFVDDAAPVTTNPEAPFGYDFDDAANLSCWWSLGAVGTWQVAGIGVAQAERYNLFEVPLHEQVKALVDLNGGDIDRIRPWLRQNHNIVNFGFLSEANTYAWRGDDVSLASVQDHRFGAMRNQAHSWQAAIDADALVFTNHPVTDRDESTDWDDDGRPGYWTGEASMPRSAQYERAAIHIYQPAWDEGADELLWAVFGYQPLTHAFVPQDRFDEVTQDDHWTRAGCDAALRSWLPSRRSTEATTASSSATTQRLPGLSGSARPHPSPSEALRCRWPTTRATSRRSARSTTWTPRSSLPPTRPR